MWYVHELTFRTNISSPSSVFKMCSNSDDDKFHNHCCENLSSFRSFTISPSFMHLLTYHKLFEACLYAASLLSSTIQIHPGCLFLHCKFYRPDTRVPSSFSLSVMEQLHFDLHDGIEFVGIIPFLDNTYSETGYVRKV
jgi:hypothetical protein